MIIFVIPLFNEAANIPGLIEKTSAKMKELGLAFRMIIVNDGSTDNSEGLIGSLSARAPITLHSYYPNKGVGAAFREGFRLALESSKDEDIIVTKEADNTSDLSILRQMILKINTGYDIALASCYAPGGKVIGTTRLKAALSKAANLLLKLFFPLKEVSTYSSFYRAYRPAALRWLFNEYAGAAIRENGFECMTEVLVKLSRNEHIKIAEVPMVLDGSRRMGASKMKIFRTIIGSLRVIFREGVLYRLYGRGAGT